MFSHLGRGMTTNIITALAVLTLMFGSQFISRPLLAQIPQPGELIFEDEFNGNSLGTSWTVTGNPPLVNGGEVTVSNGTRIQLASGFLECPIIFELEGVRFSNIGGSSGAGLSIRTLGNGSVSNLGGSSTYEWYNSGSQYMEFYSYSQNGLDSTSILSNGPTYDTATRTYTLALDTTGSVMYATGWPPSYMLKSSYPTITSGRSAISLISNGNATITCSAVRAYRSIPSTLRQVRFIERRTTRTLDFSPYKVSAISSNFDFNTYATLVVEEKTMSDNPTFSVLDNKKWDFSIMPANLNTNTTITHTFNAQDVVAHGADPAALKGFKSADGGQSWYELPNCSVFLNGENSTFTFAGQSTFSTLAIGYQAQSAVGDWQLYD